MRTIVVISAGLLLIFCNFGAIDCQEPYPDWNNVYIKSIEDTKKQYKDFNTMERFNEKLRLLEKEDNTNAIPQYTIIEPIKKPTSYNENLLKNLHKKISTLEERVDEHNRRTKLNEENIRKLHEKEKTSVWDDTKSLVDEYIVRPYGKWHKETGKQFFDTSKKTIVDNVWNPISNFFTNL